MTGTKYGQVAAIVQAQIAAGVLQPGELAPSAEALSRMTGFATLTCRKGLGTLVTAGILVPGASPSARPRVPGHAVIDGEKALARAGRALSRALVARRRAAGLTQPQLARLIGKSVTAIGHAETGRLWQGRGFWQAADMGLGADGALLALHDAYRAVSGLPAPDSSGEELTAEDVTDSPGTVVAVDSGPVTSVTINWADGTATTVYPPGAPVRSAGATPAS